MTYQEILAFVRLQLDEETDGYWADSDLRTYILDGATQFLSQSGLGTVKQNIALGQSMVAEEETQHQSTVLFIPDSPGGGSSLNGKSFIIYDTEGNAFTFIFTTAGLETTDAMRALRRYYVSISIGASASVVATAAYSVISTVEELPWTVTLMADTITLVWDEFGYTQGVQNVDVSNGVDAFTITVLVQGYDDGYFLTMPFAHEKAIFYVDASGEKTSMMRFGWEDYQAMTVEERQQSFVCYIDAFRGKISVPFTEGSLKLHYFPLATDDSLERVFTKVIPPDYHMAVCKYALYLATQRDKNITLQQTYFAEFRHFIERAKADAGSRETSNYSESFSFDRVNPHMDQNLPSMSGQFGTTRTGG